MSTILTSEQLRKILPTNKEIDEWVEALNKYLPIHGIDTPMRLAAFLAQCAHESNNFTVMQENLYYSAKGLRATWPSRFKTDEAAEAVAKQPDKIANIVYSNRMGNGSPESGDGYRYRGRGIVQVTGKDNYRACSRAVYNDDWIVDNPDFLTTKEGAIISACWFWDTNKLNAYADTGNIKEMTRKINGGYNGLADRQLKYTKALAILQG